MFEKVGKNILKFCLAAEAILTVIGLLANYDIKVALICFFGLFALDKIIEMVDYKDG